MNYPKITKQCSAVLDQIVASVPGADVELQMKLKMAALDLGSAAEKFRAEANDCLAILKKAACIVETLRDKNRILEEKVASLSREIGAMKGES